MFRVEMTSERCNSRSGTNSQGTQPKNQPTSMKKQLKKRGSMSERELAISNRRKYYGEVKGWPQFNAKVHPDVLRMLNRYRGPKSWSRFLEDIAVMLDEKEKV